MVHGIRLAHADDAALAARQFLAARRRRCARRSPASPCPSSPAGSETVLRCCRPRDCIRSGRRPHGRRCRRSRAPSPGVRRRAISPPREHAAQLHAGMFHLRLPHQLQRGRRQEHVAHGVIGHQLHRRLRLELSARDARPPARRDTRPETAHRTGRRSRPSRPASTSRRRAWARNHAPSRHWADGRAARDGHAARPLDFPSCPRCR